MVRRYVLAMVIALACSGTWLMAQPSQPIVRNPYNPPLFQRFVAPPSGVTRFLLSEAGLRRVRKARTPAAIAVLKALGESVPAISTYPAAIPPEPLFPEPELMMGPEAEQQLEFTSPLVSQIPQAPLPVGCGLDGTVFNLEPATDAAPQNGESMDFIYDGVAPGSDLVVATANDFRDTFSGLTGYYVHRAATGCAASFEGVPPNLMGLDNDTSANGNAVVVADPVRGAFFIADQHLGATATSASGTTAIGLFRTTKANLLSAAACPAGTHSAAQAATCWPQRRLVNPLPDPMNQYQQEYPSLAVDQRPSGIGAGNVYVTGTEFDFNGTTSRTWLVACTNTLSLCSAPVWISGSDPNTVFSNVRVKPDGGITVTYIDLASGGLGSALDIKFTSCQPAGAPFTPGCSPPVVVSHETQPLSLLLAAEPFFAFTFPKHTHRVDASGTKTFVVWDRCKVSASFPCPDADLVMKYSVNGGASWSAPVAVDVGPDDQFFPAITTDSSRGIVNIAYFNNHIDAQFQHLLLVNLVQILPLSTTPTAPESITSTPNDSSSDSFFFRTVGLGDSIGLAAIGTGAAGASRIYASYGYNLRPGTYSGIPGPQEDNYLVRLTY